jgi:hypothetical protein
MPASSRGHAPDRHAEHRNAVESLRQASRHLAELSRRRPTQPNILWLAEYRAAERHLEQTQRAFNPG